MVGGKTLKYIKIQYYDDMPKLIGIFLKRKKWKGDFMEILYNIEFVI